MIHHLWGKRREGSACPEISIRNKRRVPHSCALFAHGWETTNQTESRVPESPP